ncbi:anthranilate synthase component I [Qipengyuania sp. JC766]|uniref:anthranilate synthase component I n=1 Tax=Qipengyuania sp. JC766 TaxID=3232139 RepID=UPI00345AECE3
MSAAAPPGSRASAGTSTPTGRNGLVWRRIVADCETPVGAFAKLSRDGRGDFLLESVEGGSQRGRYSLIGLEPDLVYRASRGQAELNADYLRDPAAFESCAEDPVARLRTLADACRIDVPEGLPPALAFLVGYFGYETLGLVEDVPRAANEALGLPDMLFVRPTLLLVFDNLTDELFLIAPVWDGPGGSDARIALAHERIEEAERGLAAAPPSRTAAPDLPDPALAPQSDPQAYRDMVLRAKEYIAAGDVFQVVLAQRFTCDFTLPPFDLYRALRRINPSPFLYFLDLPDFAIVGSSPEILVRVREGEVTIRPIAGTRPRGATPALDRAAEAELLADPKERAEHLMLLDLGRNDVGRVAKRGTVEVTDSYTIERYSHVMHIVSNVVGELDPARDALDALFAGFPAGTVSGAPKLRACEIIAELEPETRGAYAGGVGYFAPDGSVDSCIVLRTGVVKDGVLHVQAGAGIVADSDPDYELRECEAKAGALLAAAREAVRLAREPGFGQ